MTLSSNIVQQTWTSSHLLNKVKLPLFQGQKHQFISNIPLNKTIRKKKMGSFIKQRMFCPVLIPISKYNILGILRDNHRHLVFNVWSAGISDSIWQVQSSPLMYAQRPLLYIHTSPSDSPKPDYTAFLGFLNDILIKLWKKQKRKANRPSMYPSPRTWFHIFIQQCLSSVSYKGLFHQASIRLKCYHLHLRCTRKEV